MLAPVLHGLPGKLVAIDGRPGSGKTTLGRFLAWWFNASLIETDNFLFEGEGRYRYRADEIARIADTRLRNGQPVIIEGVIVLRQLAAMNLTTDFVVYVDNARAPSLQPEYENQFKKYEAEFSPQRRADFTLSLDHDG
jgi:adenylate kinase family enzyme